MFGQVVIKRLNLWRVENPQEVRMNVLCSKGTYIRTLAKDIGIYLKRYEVSYVWHYTFKINEKMGVCGQSSTAFVTELRRTAIGELKVEDAYTLESLYEHYHTFFSNQH